VHELLALAPRQVLLDLGCGDLQLGAEMAKQIVGVVVALDRSPGLLALGYVRRRVRTLRLVLGDARQLPMASASVDRILASSVLQMTPRPDTLLRECCRVLRPGGRLVLTVPEEYRFVPRLYRPGSKARRLLRAVLRLPGEYDCLIDTLNKRFGVAGSGYVLEADLRRLLAEAELRPLAFRRVPGPIGTFIWEAAVVLSHRFGQSRVPFLLAFLLYPVALLDRLLTGGAYGCELVAAAEPVRGRG
jgi:SAM-dependent methyltransferase